MELLDRVKKQDRAKARPTNLADLGGACFRLALPDTQSSIGAFSARSVATQNEGRCWAASGRLAKAAQWRPTILPQPQSRFRQDRATRDQCAPGSMIEDLKVLAKSARRSVSISAEGVLGRAPG